MDKQDRRWPGVNGSGPWRSPSSPPSSSSAAALIPGDQTQLGDVCSHTDVFSFPASLRAKMREVDPQRWIILDYVTEVISEHSCPQGRLQGPYLCTRHQTAHVHGSSHTAVFVLLLAGFLS